MKPNSPCYISHQRAESHNCYCHHMKAAERKRADRRHDCAYGGTIPVSWYRPLRCFCWEFGACYHGFTDNRCDSSLPRQTAVSGVRTAAITATARVALQLCQLLLLVLVQPFVVLVLLSFVARNRVFGEEGCRVPYDYRRPLESSCASSADRSHHSACGAAVHANGYCL